MKKLVCVATVLMLFAASAFADCGKCAAKSKDAASSGEVAAKCAEECGGKCDGDCSSCGDGCPIAKAMEALPKMTYSVGTESTCCEHSAKALAEANGTHMHFVVGEKEFDSKDKAMLALADATEKFVDGFATPHTCSVSGKTSVCGTSMSCSKSAAAMADVAKKAMKTVAMSYKVGDTECQCPNQAAALAKDSGAKKEFVVGKATTCCAVDARIKLARAKYRAAVAALAQAEKEASTTETAASAG